NEAIVNVAEANAPLIKGSANEVVTSCARDNPVLIQLDGSAGENALPAIDEAKLRLGRVVSIQYGDRPAIPIGAALKFETLEFKVALVEAEARGEEVGTVRLIRQARNVVGTRRVKAAVKAGVGNVGLSKRILPEQLVGLAEQHVDGAALVELGCGLDASI